MNTENYSLIYKYAHLFSQLTAENLADLSKMVTDDIEFTDPFNITYGKTKFIAIFSHMFEVMIDPKFEIMDLSESQKASYIKWRLTGKVKRFRFIVINIVGISEVKVNAEGKITMHHDHWDSASQLLTLIPVIGFTTRLSLKMFKLKQ